MSKLIDKLNEAYEGPVQSIGFKAATPASAKPMLLLAACATAGSENQQDPARTSADAFIGCVDAATKESLEAIAQTSGELPWGIWSQGLSWEQLQQASDTGADFVILDPTKTPGAAIQIENMGKILRMEGNCEEALLGAVGEMPVDAVLMELGDGKETAITVYDLMLCRRVVDATFRPLLVTVASELSQEDVHALWEVGVGGIVVRSSEKNLEEQLARLQESINALPDRRDKQPEGSPVLLTKSKSGKKDVPV
jgi:hypothetical protein